MNTLLYKMIRVDGITKERRYSGSMITVPGKKFSKKTDKIALLESPSCRTCPKTGHVIEYIVERVDETALTCLAKTLREAAALLEEIEQNMARE